MLVAVFCVTGVRPISVAYVCFIPVNQHADPLCILYICLHVTVRSELPETPRVKMVSRYIKLIGRRIVSSWSVCRGSEVN